MDLISKLCHSMFRTLTSPGFDAALGAMAAPGFGGWLPGVEPVAEEEAVEAAPEHGGLGAAFFAKSKKFIIAK